MIKKALIVVDYSNDFIATDGKLTCGHPGQAIEEYIKSRLEAYHAAQQDIILQWIYITKRIFIIQKPIFFHHIILRHTWTRIVWNDR